MSRASPDRPFPRTLLVVVFFLSGVAGLGYEVVWGRWLHSVFGASAWALAAILSAFMAGLALGGFTAGRLGSRLRISPLMAYGLIEVLIGVYALIFPWLLDRAVAVQGAFFFQWVEHHTLYGLIRFGLCFVVLLIPTSLMGATFPLLSAYVARRSDQPTRWVGWLYGLNTAGAVVGTVVAGFVLVARFGLPSSNFLLAAVNFGVGLVAIRRARADASVGDRGKASEAVPQAPREPQEPRKPQKLREPQKLRREEPGATRSATPGRADLYRFILALFLVNGVFNLAHEVLWARALALIIGTTTYALSVMLAVFLAGIAAGSLWMTRRLARLRDPLGTLLRLQVAMALWVLASPILVNALPYVFLRGLWALGIGWVSSIALKCLLSALLLLPLTLGMGAVFPLGIQIAFRRPEDLAREVGDLYGINTAGGILGAFAAGFLLIPLVGVERGLAITALSHLAIVLALVWFAPEGRRRLRRHRWRWSAVGALALLLPWLTGWNPLILASGVYFQPHNFYDSNGRVDRRRARGGRRLPCPHHQRQVGGDLELLRLPGAAPARGVAAAPASRAAPDPGGRARHRHDVRDRLDRPGDRESRDRRDHRGGGRRQ